MTRAPLRDKSAMNYLFYPRSIAVIGASDDPSKPGGAPLKSLLKNGYTGQMYPVNPKAAVVAGLPSYPSLAAIPGEVDLVILAIAAKPALVALRECGEKGVKAAIIFSSGFAEVGEAGAAIQVEMTAIAQKYGISVCGPNCMGIFNAVNNMFAGFLISGFRENLAAPEFFGFVSQSGGFIAVMHAAALDRSLGPTYLISSGNEADLQFADYLAYMVEDPATKVIGGYIEGIPDGRKLMQAADLALAAQKPIVVIKSGKSPAAAKAAASHTGALAGSDRVYDAFFKQKGIIRASSVEEQATILSILAAGKLPAGNRAGIVVYSGGNGVLLADKCLEAGLEVAQFNRETEENLERLLPAFGVSTNPVDLTSQIMSDVNLFQASVRMIVQDPNVDFLILMHWSSADFTLAVQDILASMLESPKPVLVVIWGSDNTAQADLQFFRDRGIPAVREMDFATSSMASLARYSARLKARQNRKAATPEDLAIGVIAQQQPELLQKYPAGATLSESQAKEVLRECGLTTTREAVAASPEEAVAIAARLGYPVVLKIDSPDIPHKTEAGGVRLNLTTAAQVTSAYGEILEKARQYRPDAAINGVLVQEMLSGGLEVIAGINRDASFGPVVMFGLGGVWVEALADVTLRVAPIDAVDAAEMLDEIKGAAVLKGLRGQPPGDREALITLLVKLSQIAMAFPAIDQIDLNPILVYPPGKGIRIADALITLR